MLLLSSLSYAIDYRSPITAIRRPTTDPRVQITVSQPHYLPAFPIGRIELSGIELFDLGRNKLYLFVLQFRIDR